MYFCYANGAKGFEYEGEWKDNCIEGTGVMRSENGEIYTGRFQKNMKEGEGCLKKKNGDVYQGKFHNNMYEGYGSLVLFGGKFVYEGEFKESQFEGRGRVECVDGCFEGMFKKNRLDGQGKWFKSNGDVYIGSFSGGKPHGKGVYINESNENMASKMEVECN